MGDADGQAAFFAAVNVSRETSERLRAYAALLEKWNPAINLVSRSTIPALWTRHFLDSAQLLPIAPDTARTWLDLGAGGGFPGLVLAILAAEQRPELKFTLVESDARKSAFLLKVVAETGIGAKIETARAESLPPQAAEVLSARALAPILRLLPLAQQHLAEGGICLFPKGANHSAELDAALASWTFRVQKHPSRTEETGVILEIGGIRRV